MIEARAGTIVIFLVEPPSCENRLHCIVITYIQYATPERLCIGR